MSRILLIRPPSVFSASTYSAPVVMPVALAYLSANLLKHGHQVSAIDALGEDINHVATSYDPRVRYRGLSNERILERIPERPDGIGVTAMFSQDWPHIEGMINALHAKFPDVPLILGGEHATAASHYVLQSCPAVTHVALGEGEETIVEWADWLDHKKTIEEVSGIHHRSRDGKVIANPPRPRIQNPDDLPWPAWQLFHLEPYFEVNEGHGVERGRSMPIISTRGCPYQCAFCSNPQMWTTRYIMRSVSGVVDEIERYLREYRADNIDFFDLTAVLKKEWLLDFCQEIRLRKLKFTWQLPSGTRPNALDAEVLKEMAATGCMNMTYAPESGSKRTLQEIKKQVHLPHIFDSIRHAKRNGIFVKCNLIIGFPRETRWDMWQTLWCALRFAVIGVDDTGIYPYSPYPGSELYRYLRSTGAISEMNRSYFMSLMTFMDLKRASNYCEKAGPIEIDFYRLTGMAVFYCLSYLLRPGRILRSLSNYRTRKSDTVFEERFFAFLRRRKLEKNK